MARDVASLSNRTVVRCLTLIVAFALLLHGHQVLESVSVFGLYMALCSIAMVIVFQQTRVSHVHRHVVVDGRQEVDIKGAHMHLQQISSELGLLQREYNEDLKRLERKWL